VSQNVPPRKPPSDQEIVAPFWTTGPGWNSQLEIRNNQAKSELEVTPVLQVFDGTELTLPSVKVGPDEVKQVDLSRIAASLGGHAEAYGSVVFRYKSVSRGNVYAAVLVQRLGHPISIHFDAMPVDSTFGAGSQEGIWWLPNPTTDGFLIISNFASRPVMVQETFTDGTHLAATQLALKPHQTSRISIREAVQHAAFTSTQGGIKVSMASDAGSVYVSEFLFDEDAGFSALMKVFERDPKSAVEAVTLRAPLVGLSAPDTMLGYPPDVVLRPTLFIRNSSPAKVDATLQVAWKSPTANGSIPMKVQAIGPEETRLVDLNILQKQGLPPDANWANVSLNYTGRPGDLVPVAASYDATTRYGLQSPFSSTLGSMWKGGMWHVDALHDSLITTGNAGASKAKIVITLFYSQNGVYEIASKDVAAGGQLFIDVGELIRDQVPDASGRTIPPDVMEGSYEIRDDNDKNIGYLYEGKVITDKTFGHATYGCGSCCGYDDSYLLPDPLIGPMGSGGGYTVYGVNACTGQGIALGGAYNWASSVQAVGTVNSSGYLTMISPGTTNVSSYIKLRTAGVNNCPLQLYGQSAPGNVQPTITGPNVVWWFNGQNPSPSSYPVSITLQSSGGASTTWALSQSDSKVSLSSTTGASIQVTSTGTHFSSSTGDISITAKANGQPSAPFTITSKTPWKLVFDAQQSGTTCYTGYGYLTDLLYDLHDQFDSVIPNDVTWNEVVGTPQSQNGSNWGTYGLTTSSGSTGPLIDQLSGPGVNNQPPPNPTPVCHTPPTGTTVYRIASQVIRVGSTNTGSGVEVQTDNLTYYIDNGAHTSIVVPPPPPQ
jgi:hypothetical protein